MFFKNSMSKVRAVFDDFLAMPRAEATLRLTLFLLLLYGATSWMAKVPLKMICGLMLVSPLLTGNRVLWFAIFAILVLVNAQQWYGIDNHKYLITYWAMACALATSTKFADVVLSRNGRALIGLAFLAATIWKFAAGEYIDGSFLHFTFLEDGRLKTPAELITGFNYQQLSDNRKLIGLVAGMPSDDIRVTLATTDRLGFVTLLMSYWTLFIEGLIALTFLLPKPNWFSKWRDVSLMVFVCTTYFLLPVIGFASILMLMGFAQCEKERTKTRLAYLAIFILIPLIQVPWRKYLMPVYEYFVQ